MLELMNMWRDNASTVTIICTIILGIVLLMVSEMEAKASQEYAAAELRILERKMKYEKMMAERERAFIEALYIERERMMGYTVDAQPQVVVKEECAEEVPQDDAEGVSYTVSGKEIATGALLGVSLATLTVGQVIQMTTRM